jgi:hypothetical protein
MILHGRTPKSIAKSEKEASQSATAFPKRSLQETVDEQQARRRNGADTCSDRHEGVFQKELRTKLSSKIPRQSITWIYTGYGIVISLMSPEYHRCIGWVSHGTHIDINRKVDRGNSLAWTLDLTLVLNAGTVHQGMGSLDFPHFHPLHVFFGNFKK